MSAEVQTTILKTEKLWNKPPISLDFQVLFLNDFVGAYVYRKWLESEVFKNLGQEQLQTY